MKNTTYYLTHFKLNSEIFIKIETFLKHQFAYVNMVSGKLVLMVVTLVVASLVLGCTGEKPPAAETKTPTPEAQTPKNWRWGTADPGSYGYRVISGVINNIKDDVPGYEFSINPYSSTTAAIKGFCKGEVESTYLADLGARKLYDFTGPFEGFKSEVKQMPVQTFWAYTMETFLLTTEENADKIKSWSDLDGKPVFMTPSGYMNHLNLRRAFAALGVEPQHVEVDSKFVCKALEEGTIVATGLYTTARVSLPTWGQELTISCKGKLVPIKMTSEEIQKIEAAGYQVVEVDLSKVTDIKDTAHAVPFYFGYHASVNMPEDAVYNLLKSVEKNADRLTQVDPGLKPLVENVAEFQIGGIKSADPNIMPIHPGLAKYLKEKGLWNSEWDEHIAKK